MFVLSWFCWYLIYILIIKYWLLSLPTIIFCLGLVKRKSMHTDTHYCILLTLRINYQLHHWRIIFLVLPGFTIQSQNLQKGKWIKVKIKNHLPTILGVWLCFIKGKKKTLSKAKAYQQKSIKTQSNAFYFSWVLTVGFVVCSIEKQWYHLEH